ncbi:hypothetical protein [Phreatobacter sp.]
MSSTSLFVAEFALTALVVLGFCAHQLRQLRRLERERKAKDRSSGKDGKG